MTDDLWKNIIPDNDQLRLDALRDYDILYTSSEEAFDNITQMMAQVFRTPMSFVSLIDKETVFYKSQVGPFGKSQVHRNDSLCSFTILNSEPLIIEDASTIAHLSNNPYVAQSNGIRFYAGAPLITRNGFHIGTACIVDIVPRTFSESDKELLVRFARMVMHEIEVRHAVKNQLNAEKKLLDSFKELQFVMDTMPQLVWATEPDGYSFFFNKGWLDYTGLGFDDVKGDGWTQSLHPYDLERTFSTWRKAVETGSKYDIEYRLKRYDGVYRWFVARGTPMKDEQEKIVKWYGTSTDIQEQKSIQEDLFLSKERFELLTNATRDAVWDWNLLTNEIWWNDGFKTLFGYTDDDIEPGIESWYNRVHPDDKERIIGGIHKVIDNDGKSWWDEYRFLKKDGQYAVVYDRGYALHNQEGVPYRMLGSMQDITRQRTQHAELLQSEKRFQAAVAAVQGILWTNNAEGEMEGEQPGWSAITGQRYDEYHGYGWTKAVHPDDADATVTAWRQAVEQKKTFVFEHRVKTKDGNWRLFSIRANPVLLSDGTIKEWVGVHTDITEKRQVEEIIRLNEQRFQNLIRDASVGIVVLMGEEMIVSVVNAAYGRLINRSVDDLLNQRLFDIIPDAEKPFRAILDKVRLSGESIFLYDTPYSVVTKGEKIEGYLNVIYQPFKEADGTITGVMALCHDITEQVLSRKKAEEAEETANLAISAAGMGSFYVDLTTNFIEGSERLDEIFEVAHSNERNRYIDAIHPDDLDKRKAAYEKAFVDGLLEYEARLLRKNGNIRWIRAMGRIFFDEANKPVKLVGVIQDITDEKQFAEELSRKVNERTQELEQFTFVSHHDLQEPLRKIIMFSDMVRQESYDKLSETSKKRMDSVMKAAYRMSTVLRDVLNFASLSKEELTTTVDLNEVLTAVETDLELVITEKNAIINSEKLPVLKGVPQQMHQLLYNLIINALKFSKPGLPPQISIHCEVINDITLLEHLNLKQHTSYYQIAVKDNGIGFNQSSAEKIFILFQRLHSKDVYPGTGIGLAMCKKVVTNHGGKIIAQSEPGEGSTFTIYLPVN